MKRLSIIVLPGLALALGVIWLVSSASNAPEQPNRTSSKELGKYYLKNNGKLPKAERLARPSDWKYVQRSWPLNDIPKDRVEAGFERARLDKQLQRLNKDAADFETWYLAGPENVPGRIVDLAVHPTDPNTFFAASASGGVFKTTDLGASWTSIFDDVGTFSVGAVAIDPSDPDIIYAGTGEANASSGDFSGDGVWKTVNGGATWNHIGLDSSYHIGRIVVDPLNTQRVFVAATGRHFDGTNPDRGLYRSLNGGTTWDKVLYIDDTTACIDVALHPSTNTVFAAMWTKVRRATGPNILGGVNSGVYRSTDGGTTWTRLFGGLPAAASNIGRIGVSVDPMSQTVYAVYSYDNGSYLDIFKSTDLGTTWVVCDDGASDVFGSWNGGWYFGQIRVAPGDPDIAYVLGVLLYRTIDGGDSWEFIGNGVHVDHHAMHVSPSDNERVYLGNDGGVAVSDNGGTTWAQSYEMGNTQFYAIEIDPSNPHRLLGGTQDNGTNMTYTGGLDDWQNILGGDGFYCLVDPTNPNVVYAESQFGNLYKSTDSGATFFWAQNGIDPGGTERHNWSTPIAFDPSNSQTLYYGTNYLYRSTDGALSWSVISPDLTDGPWPKGGFGTITTIDVFPSSIADIIWVGTDDGNVWVSNGITFGNVSGSLPQRWVTRVAADPNHSNIAYVTFSGFKWSETQPRVFRTTNLGSSWTDISGNLPDAPVNDIIPDPEDSLTLVVGTDIGVYITYDLGVNWEPLGVGMPIAAVFDLDFDVTTRKLVAGTHGRSMWATQLNCTDPNDADGDGWGDACDNCVNTPNPTQADWDKDNIGDVCDECTDLDGDGYGDPGFPFNTCPEDNCAEVYNPDQSDANDNGIGDVCELGLRQLDVMLAECTRLMVANDGNIGNQGSENAGGYNLVDYNDCNANATIQLYDGSPVVAYTIDGGLTKKTAYSMFGYRALAPVSGYEPTQSTTQTAEYYTYSTGTFVSTDTRFGMERSYWAPYNEGAECNYIVQCTKFFSFDGGTHTGLYLGEAIDWDVPTDNGNTAGVDVLRRMVYFRGVESGNTPACRDDERYSGMAMIAVAADSACGVDTAASAYGGYANSNPTFVYPAGRFVDAELYDNMSAAGFFPWGGSSTDLHGALTYLGNTTLGPGDTIRVYSVVAAVRGSLNDLRAEIDAAKEWFFGTVIAEQCPPPGCCLGIRGDANGDASDGDVADIVFMVEFAFGQPAGPAPVCEEEADVNGDASSSDVADIVYLVEYAFGQPTGPAPISCP